jgi:type II secretory pathway pseudopilin PulG
MHTRGRGFTLAELVLALAITTVIGLAVTGVAAAVSNFNERAETYYEYLQSGRVAAIRLQEMMRPALLITAASGDNMVVWTNNQTDPNNINVTEVTKVFLDASTGQLMQRTTVFPDSMSASTKTALDTSLALSTLTSASVATSEPIYAQYDVTRVLARNVQSFDVYPDVSAPLTRLLKFKLVVGADGQTVTQYGAVMLRAPSTAKVSGTTGNYVLN